MLICDMKECTGCSGCMNICPVNAITMVCDELGKRIARIDESKCIGCNKCVKTCPNNNPITKKPPLICYALWSNEKADQTTCASGGVATAFSRYVIKERGVVFGAAFNDRCILEHVGTEKEEELEKLKGSKYVESRIAYSYRKVLHFLKEGRMVLFIGVPCQIQGLKQYLARDYENLLTIELICHGTPPAIYLKEYLEHLQLVDLSEIRFRGSKDYYLCCYKGDKLVYQNPSDRDDYFLSFLSYLIQRENCYGCKYASIERVSDITIGDFWGIDRESLKNKYNGKISIALINTKKGEEFFNKVKDGFTYEERKLEEGLKGNEQLSHPPRKHKDRERFESYYRRFGFVKAIHHTNIPYQIKKNKLKAILKKLEIKMEKEKR